MRYLIAVLLLAGCWAKTDVMPGGAFLDARYVNSPLGEGAAPDADPLIRFDAFDCTTFVETVMADGQLAQLNKIRYADGAVGFLNRNHFIESDWLTNNVDLVENVSAEFGETKIRTVTIDKKSWLRRVHDMDSNFSPVTVDLEYLPYSEFSRIRTSEPLVVLFVVDNPDMHQKIGTDLAVVHMGILGPGNVLRHASSEHDCVMDVSFTDYVAQRKKSVNNLGVVLLRYKK